MVSTRDRTTAYNNVLTVIEVLSISRGATKVEIKKAYHKVEHDFLQCSPPPS